MKIGLYTISFAGVWYDGPGLPLEEIFTRAKDMGYEGVEIGARRPHASPMDLDAKARERLREQAAKAGLEIPAVASYNNFASPVLEQRENEVLMVREQIRLARDLGAPVLRLFAAWNGTSRRDGHGTYEMCRNLYRHPDVLGIERWQFVRESLKEVADFAGEQGVTLALQNHEPIIERYWHMLEFIQEVNSPALKACLDAPLLKDQTDEYVAKAVADTGALQIHSHYGGEWEERDGEVALSKWYYGAGRPTNYPTFVKALKKIGYTGYLCYEFCHPALVDHTLQGLDFVAGQVAMAARYMKKLIG